MVKVPSLNGGRKVRGSVSSAAPQTNTASTLGASHRRG